MKDINLLPDDLKGRQGQGIKLEELRDKVDPKMILVAIAVVLTLIFVFFVPLLYNNLLEQKLFSIQGEIKSQAYERVRKARKDMADEKLKIDTKKKTMTEIDTVNMSVTELFSAITGIMPAGCTVSTLNYTGKTLVITGNVVEDIQIGEILSRAKRLNFLDIDGNASISYDAKKNFSFSFNLAGNGGKK